jgi:hypothetical protein
MKREPNSRLLTACTGSSVARMAEGPVRLLNAASLLLNLLHITVLKYHILMPTRTDCRLCGEDSDRKGHVRSSNSIAFCTLAVLMIVFCLER